MSHPKVWPNKTFFHPIGNTPPVCLTDHLPPEENANILLLGCGDPRSILYTIAVDHGHYRKMDLTCCDLEPAIIARNILLFTLIIDSVESDKLLMYWNIFYDLFLDPSSASLLREQCDKLVAFSTNLNSWSSSPYSGSLAFVTEDSLVEARRHWQLYKETVNLSACKQQELKKDFHSAMKENISRGPDVSPLYAFTPVTCKCPNIPKTRFEYWRNGITGSKDKHKPLINPTFLFSLAGRKFSLHYSTDPCSSFHMALAAIKTTDNLPNTIPAKTEHEMWTVCRAQFSSWCTAFHKRFLISLRPQSVAVRFVVADALNFSQSLRSYQNGTLETTVYKTSWGGSKIHFHDSSTPKFFNVIDTSNLSDNLGLLNILVATQPIIENSPCSVIHTNTLISCDDLPVEKSGIKERALLDLPSISLFLGIIPICFYSGFNFRNNSEASESPYSSLKSVRNYQRTSWKVCDVLCTDLARGLLCSKLIVDPKELADKLFALYLKMFGEERPAIFFHDRIGAGTPLVLEDPHYDRESFVRFVSTVKMSNRLETNWKQVGDRLIERTTGSRELMLETNNFQNILAQLHIYGVYSVPPFILPDFTFMLPNSPPFQGWDSVPPVVCVVFLVPRTALEVLDVNHNAPLECETHYTHTSIRDTHSSIRPIFGELVVLPDGLGAIQEDPRGIDGDSPLLVSFHIASTILGRDPDLTVALTLKPTQSTALAFLRQLGPRLCIFEKCLTNRKHVFIFRERPDNVGELKDIAGLSISSRPGVSRNPVLSKLSFKDGLGWICNRLDVIKQDEDRLANNATVMSKQVAPCCIVITLGGLRYPLYFPVPVNHNLSKVRIARKSGYVEIEAPCRMSPYTQMDLSPFPVSTTGPYSVASWNTPYLNLSRMASASHEDLRWAFLHGGFTFSKEERDRFLRLESNPNEETTSVLFKSVIRSLFLFFSLGGGAMRIISLFSNNQTIAIIFLDCVKIDLSSSTAIGDAVVVIPEASNLMLIEQLQGVQPVNCIGEVTRWLRYALPAFAERCRTWGHTSTCEYVLAYSYPLPLEKVLCSCGKGKNLGPFMQNPMTKDLVPYATRIAISSIFPVSYLEDVKFDVKAAFEKMDGRAKGNCSKCKGSGKPKLLQCSGCKAVKYCSVDCQKEDWKVHKAVCKKFKNAEAT